MAKRNRRRQKKMWLSSIKCEDAKCTKSSCSSSTKLGQLTVYFSCYARIKDVERREGDERERASEQTNERKQRRKCSLRSCIINRQCC